MKSNFRLVEPGISVQGVVNSLSDPPPTLMNACCLEAFVGGAENAQPEVLRKMASVPQAGTALIG